MASKADLKRARDRWTLATAATEKQRQRERADLQFLVDHWPSDVRAARAGQAALNGMPPVPARPCIQVDQISEPIARVTNQYRSSDLGIEVVPADDFSDLGIELDDTEIKLREGLVRRIQRDPDAEDARLWAFQRAVQAGEGYYLVTTKYLPGKWDKEIILNRIYDQNLVRLDPAHEQPDGSDCEWEHIGMWMPWDIYKATYPSAAGRHNKISSASDREFDDFAKDQPEWVDATPEARAVFVVGYWYRETAMRALVQLSDGSAAWRDELPKDFDESFIIDEREEPEHTVYFCKLDGVNDFALEETEEEDNEMPIIKVMGTELQPFDGEKRVQGMVRPARESQFGLDAMISKQVEAVALAPTPALHVDPVAIEGYEPWYGLSNTRTLPYLPSRTYDDNGRQLAPPTRLNAEPNLMPIAQSILLFKEGIQSTTSTSDPALGRADSSVKSARHAQYLIEESNFGTSQFLDNLLRSMRREGKVINAKLYYVYGKRPGRMVNVLTGEGESQSIRVNPQTPQDAQNLKTAQKVGKLTKDAKFNVAIKLTKNATLKSDAVSSFIGALLEANPLFMTWFGDIWLKNQSGVPGHQEMAERTKAMLDPKIQKMLADKEQGKEIPPEAQQQIARLTEQVQMADAAIKELSEEANGKKIESETKLRIEQMQSERDLALEELRTRTELEKARMDNATKIHVAEIAAHTKGVQMAHEAEHEAVAMDHEAAMAEVAADRSDASAQQDREHEAAMTGAEADADSDEAALGREHESELTQAQLDAQQETAETRVEP